MKWSRLIKYGLVILPTSLGWIYVSCQKPDIENQQEEAVNTNWWALGDSLHYVGIETCKDCHYEIYSTYQHTGMGSSFGIADTFKSAIPRSGDHFVFDKYSGFYYRPYFKNGHLWLQEFRMSGADTTYHQHIRIDYVIGSGHHTNSHIIDLNGYLFQVPITYYTQSGRLDLPPGFEEGNNSRFSRPIGLECMSCHNAMPTGFVFGSENKFSKLALGIDCERCHGPGSGHVNKILRGDFTDTSQTPDYSIVNPKRLPVNLRFEICQRCHLQGNAVLVDGKSFFDFKPGMRLREVMDIYLPKYEDDDHFIMASHADRLSQSKCFTNSKGKLDCTTCHNPHITSRKLKNDFFNEKCTSCHAQNDCKEKKSLLSEKNNDCVVCHMPVSGSIDIPHVTIHEHKIAVHKKLSKTQKKQKIIALISINNTNPTVKSRIKAYLQQFERFEPIEWYLDSAYTLLSNVNKKEFIREWIHYLYLKKDSKNDYLSILPLVRELLIDSSFNTTSWSNENAWFWYRVAHLTDIHYSINEALKYYKKAVDLAPFHYEFQSKYAIALAKNGFTKEAIQIMERLLAEIPFLYEVSNNLGYLYLMEGNYKKAEFYLLKSIEKNPVYIKAYSNLIILYNQTEQKQKIEKLLTKIKREIPEFERELNSLFQ